MGLRWYALRRRRRGWRRLAALGLLLAVLAVGVQAAGRSLRRLMAVYGESRCRNQVLTLLLETAETAMADKAFYQLTETEQGSRLQLDGSVVNQCRAEAGRELALRLEQLCAQRQRIPLGTLLNSPLLLDRGPGIPLRVVPVGAGQVQVRSALRDAGVNQVLYTLTMELTVTVTMILPGETRELCCSQQVPLGEVLFSGQVPSAYGTFDSGN